MIYEQISADHFTMIEIANSMLKVGNARKTTTSDNAITVDKPLPKTQSVTTLITISPTQPYPKPNYT